MAVSRESARRAVASPRLFAGRRCGAGRLLVLARGRAHTRERVSARALRLAVCGRLGGIGKSEIGAQACAGAHADPKGEQKQSE
jgi:hypothetical protein